MIPDFRAVVPAGGAGTRLWPLSRAGSPKFLHDLTGTGRSLIQATVDRLLPLTGPQGIVVVTGTRHREAVTAQLPELDAGAVIAEPSPKDSMAAIGLAAAVLLQSEPDVVIGSFAADHVIEGDGFADAVHQAVATATQGFVVTVGIAATEPSTAFGYVRSGDVLDVPGAPSARRARGFTEKPDATTAAAYLATGEYRWNAGMFVVRAQVLLDHLARLNPPLHEGLMAIAEAWHSDLRASALERYWPHLPTVAIDRAIAEPVAAEGGVAMVPGDFAWHDVGDFASLASLLPADASGARVLGGGPVLAIDADRVLAVGTGDRLIAVLGIDDVVVVDTGDALLVTTRHHAQQLKSVVEAVRERHPDLL